MEGDDVQCLPKADRTRGKAKNVTTSKNLMCSNDHNKGCEVGREEGHLVTLFWGNTGQ